MWAPQGLSLFLGWGSGVPLGSLLQVDVLGLPVLWGWGASGLGVPWGSLSARVGCSMWGVMLEQGRAVGWGSSCPASPGDVPPPQAQPGTPGEGEGD